MILWNANPKNWGNFDGNCLERVSSSWSLRPFRGEEIPNIREWELQILIIKYIKLINKAPKTIRKIHVTESNYEKFRSLSINTLVFV